MIFANFCSFDGGDELFTFYSFFKMLQFFLLRFYVIKREKKTETGKIVTTHFNFRVEWAYLGCADLNR